MAEKINKDLGKIKSEESLEKFIENNQKEVKRALSEKDLKIVKRYIEKGYKFTKEEKHYIYYNTVKLHEKADEYSEKMFRKNEVGENKFEKQYQAWNTLYDTIKPNMYQTIEELIENGNIKEAIDRIKSGSPINDKEKCIENLDEYESKTIGDSYSAYYADNVAQGRKELEEITKNRGNNKILKELLGKKINNKQEKIDYDKGKEALINKLKDIPKNDKLTKNESDFIAKNYPEMIQDFTNHFNWKESAKEVVKWGGEENIKKNIEKIDLREVLDTLSEFEPELYVKIKPEINRKVAIIPNMAVPKVQILELKTQLEAKGFDNTTSIYYNLNELYNSTEAVSGTKIIDCLSEITGQEDYLNGIKYDYNKGIQLIKQGGLNVDEKNLSFIKINDIEHIQIPLLGKNFEDIKFDLENLLKGKETDLIEGLSIKGETFDAKLQFLIDSKTGKISIKSSKKAMVLDIPEELTESEKQKLKNGELISLSKGFLYNYRNIEDKTALYIRKIAAKRKMKNAKKQEVKASMQLDKDLNKLIVKYNIKDEGAKNNKEIVATVIANGDKNPTVFIKDDRKGKSKDKNEEKENKLYNKEFEKVEKAVSHVVKEIKKNDEKTHVEKDIIKDLGLKTKRQKTKPTIIKAKL